MHVWPVHDIPATAAHQFRMAGIVLGHIALYGLSRMDESLYMFLNTGCSEETAATYVSIDNLPKSESKEIQYS